MPSPRRPTKIPFDYIVECLFDSNIRVSRSTLRRIAVDDGTMIPLHRLRTRFPSIDAFEDFKNTYLQDIPDTVWEGAVQDNPRLKSYANRFMRNPFRSRSLKMKAYVDSPAGRRHVRPLSDDESVMVIDPTNDPHDPTNVNLPKSVCRGIRSVCRYYDDHERYAHWNRDDGSEGHLYRFNVEYDEPPPRRNDRVDDSDSD